MYSDVCLYASTMQSKGLSMPQLPRPASPSLAPDGPRGGPNNRPAQTGADSGLPVPQRFWAILAVSLNTVMVVLDSSMIVVALPTAARALSITHSQAVSLVAITQFIALIGLLPLSALGDRFGHKRVFRAGQLLFLLGSILCVMAPSVLTLLAARAVQAAGAAAVLSVGIALLRSIYPSTLLGRGLGFNGVLVAMGSALAPSLGGMIVATLGWRWIFICPLPLVVGSLILGRSLPRSAALHLAFDWRGALIYMVAAGSIAGAFSCIAYWWHPAMSAILLGVALGVGTLFVRRELRIARPILPVDLLAKPRFALSISAAFVAFCGSMTMLLSLPFLLEARVGDRPATMGALMMAWPLAMMVSAPLAGFLADRVPTGSLSALGMSIACTGYLVIAMAPADATHIGLILRIAMCGFGMGFFISPNSRLLIGSAPRARTASAGGMLSTTRILGQSSGAALVALLMQPGVGHARSAPFIAAGFALVAALLSLGHLLGWVRRSADAGLSQDQASVPIL
jgi:DHA2 family multidrug resistance protein-like MFS transporter